MVAPVSHVDLVQANEAKMMEPAHPERSEIGGRGEAMLAPETRNESAQTSEASMMEPVQPKRLKLGGSKKPCWHP
jgi:hypothetical protein